MLPFGLPTPLPPGGMAPAPVGSWMDNLFNSTNSAYGSFFVRNGVFGEITVELNFTQQYIGQHVFGGSWTDNLFNSSNPHYVSEIGTINIVGSWTNNLFNGSNTDYGSHFNESDSTYHNSFTNTLNFTDAFATIPISGLITNTLAFTYAMPSTHILNNQSFTNKITFVNQWKTGGNSLTGQWVNSLFNDNNPNFDQNYIGKRTISRSWTNNLFNSTNINYASEFIHGYWSTHWTDNLFNGSNTDYSQSYTGKRNVLGSWKDNLFNNSNPDYDNYFVYGINPSRSWSDNLFNTNNADYEQLVSGVVLDEMFTIRYGDLVLKLPQPELGNRLKPVINMNKLVSLNGTTRTYLKRPIKRSTYYEFIVDQYYKILVKSFFDTAFDKLLTVQFAGDTFQVNLTSNPIRFETTTRYRIKFVLQFEGVFEGPWQSGNVCVGHGF